MKMDATKITGLIPNLVYPNAADSTEKPDQEFGDILKGFLNKTNDQILTAEKMIQDYTLGKDVELHQVIMASEQANLALQMTMQVRNKIIEAYQEVMRMQV